LDDRSRFASRVAGGDSPAAATCERFEQFLDFARWQMFRQTLLCRDLGDTAPRPASRRVVSAVVRGGHAGRTAAYPLSNGESVAFQRPQSRLSTSVPIAKAALLTLAGTWPRLWPFERLLRAVASAIGNQRRPMCQPPRCRSARDLGGHASAGVGNRAHRGLGRAAAGRGRGRRSALRQRLVAAQGERTSWVPNQAHTVRVLNGFQRMLLAQLDGQQDRDTLLGWLETFERKTAIRWR
jgi:hypothetical protein